MREFWKVELLISIILIDFDNFRATREIWSFHDICSIQFYVLLYSIINKSIWYIFCLCLEISISLDFFIFFKSMSALTTKHPDKIFIGRTLDYFLTNVLLYISNGVWRYFQFVSAPSRALLTMQPLLHGQRTSAKVNVSFSTI